MLIRINNRLIIFYLSQRLMHYSDSSNYISDFISQISFFLRRPEIGHYTSEYVFLTKKITIR